MLVAVEVRERCRDRALKKSITGCLLVQDGSDRTGDPANILGELTAESELRPRLKVSLHYGVPADDEVPRPRIKRVEAIPFVLITETLFEARLAT